MTQRLENGTMVATKASAVFISIAGTLIIAVFLGPLALMSGPMGLVLLVVICYVSIWNLVNSLIIKPTKKWNDLYNEFKYFKAEISADLNTINFNGCTVPLAAVDNGTKFVQSQAFKFYSNNTYLVYDPDIEKSVLVAVEKRINRPLLPILHEISIPQFRALERAALISESGEAENEVSFPKQGPSNLEHIFYKFIKAGFFIFSVVILLMTFLTHSNLNI